MKVLVLITWTDCENKHRSLSAIGHEVHTLQYDALPHDRHQELVDEAKRIKPDFIVFIGAVEAWHRRPVPTFDTLRRFREVAPLIHMCDDAADDPWWEWLELYHDKECFDVQVAIDGNHECPLSKHDNGMVLLTPIDHRVFTPYPWDERNCKMSLVGGLGHGPRGDIVGKLRNGGHLSFFEGPANRTYEQMADILCNSRFVFNHPMTGSAKRMHVKGRVVEAGFAGACLIEHKDSPTANWFTRGTHYLSYGTVDDVIDILNMPLNVERVAERFHNAVVTAHHPKLFWDKVLKKAGVGPT